MEGIVNFLMASVSSAQGTAPSGVPGAASQTILGATTQHSAPSATPQSAPGATPPSAVDAFGTPQIDALPDEVMLMIFSHLTPACLLRRAALVCKKWYNLAMDKSIWRHKTAWFHWGEPWRFTVSVKDLWVLLARARFYAPTSLPH